MEVVVDVVERLLTEEAVENVVHDEVLELVVEVLDVVVEVVVVTELEVVEVVD